MVLRHSISILLQAEDPSGRLEVAADGPRWISEGAALHVSYSHTEGAALLVWSRKGPLGVDVESASRKLKEPPLRLAERFFAPAEVARLRGLERSPQEQMDAFLWLWLKKEALGKLTRKGLRDSIHLEVDAQNSATFEEVPLVPEGYRAIVALTPR